jgi:hypothetical protein
MSISKVARTLQNRSPEVFQWMKEYKLIEGMEDLRRQTRADSIVANPLRTPQDKRASPDRNHQELKKGYRYVACKTASVSSQAMTSDLAIRRRSHRDKLRPSEMPLHLTVKEGGRRDLTNSNIWQRRPWIEGAQKAS